MDYDMTDKPRAISACYALMASIIQRAAKDACTLDATADAASARVFLQPDNKLFLNYCTWLDLEPEWAAQHIHKTVIKHEFCILINTILQVERMRLGILPIPKRITRQVARAKVQRRKLLGKLQAARTGLLDLWDDIYVHRHSNEYTSCKARLYRALKDYGKRWPYDTWGHVW
jgi:hypothetical protein